MGDESRRITFAQRQELLYDKGQAIYESTVVSAARRDDLHDDLLQSYAESVSHPNPHRLLAARGLIARDGQLTVASVLLFAAHPQRWLPEASVRVLRYRGTEGGTGARQQLLDDVRIEGPIPIQLTKARQEIFERLPTRRALAPSGRFVRVSLVPQDAWFEEMRLAGLADPVYYQTSGSLRLTLTSMLVDRALEARLPEGARDLVRIVREAGRPRTGDLVEASGWSRPVVLRRLRALRRAGVVTWTGHSKNDPRAYWSLRVE